MEQAAGCRAGGAQQAAGVMQPGGTLPGAPGQQALHPASGTYRHASTKFVHARMYSPLLT